MGRKELSSPERRRKETQKRYREKNKEKIKERDTEYWKSPAGLKIHRIYKWKSRGVKSDNFDELYEYYLNCNNCEECNVALTNDEVCITKKVLDHNHITGKFRNILCHKCNIVRK